MTTTTTTRRRKRDHESPDLVAMLNRVAKALVRRAAEGDLEAVSALRQAERTMGSALIEAAQAAHSEPNAYSWTEIGRELGMTRQAAQQRFGSEDEQ
jgi:hypothetical protein